MHAVVVCGTAPSAADVATPLRAPGLLDCTLTLRAPAAEDRAALLASALQAKAVLFDGANLQARCQVLTCHQGVSAVTSVVSQILVMQGPLSMMRGHGVLQQPTSAPSLRSMLSMASPVLLAVMACS